MTAWFVATEKFGPWDGELWQKYCDFAKIPGLVEVASLDCILCPRLVIDQPDEELHRLFTEYGAACFHDLDQLLKHVAQVPSRNILGIYRNPHTHEQTKPATGDFVFLGYDLIEEATGISALTNCGGFRDAFANSELNQCGLLPTFARAKEVQRHLAGRYPKDAHAQCALYALWRLNEPQSARVVSENLYPTVTIR